MPAFAYLLLCVVIILTGTASAELHNDVSAPVAVSPNMKIDRLVIKFDEQAKVRLRKGELVSFSRADLSPLKKLLSGMSVSRLFLRSEAELDQERSDLRERGFRSTVDKNSYFQLLVEDVEQAADIVNSLNKLSMVEIAYIEPEPEPAQDIPPPTPDLSGSQGYLYNPPEGIGASYCWSIPGGTGAGVDIIDIEGNWNNDHEDFGANFGSILVGTPVPLLDWINHGTASTGEIGGDSNEYGITGIAYDAHIDLISTGDIGFAAAIDFATQYLQAGDIIMVELHTPGPRYGFDPRPDQMGYVPMEYFQANFDAIQMAAAKGIVVVEVAGNGYENLDDPIYESRFNRSYRDSRAILVGAGAPPNGLFGPDRTRLYFSNFGSRLDLQGWGKSVVTTGYGGLFNGDMDIDQFYTGTFSGTSAATPMVAGAVACLQGIYKAQYGFGMTPEAVTALLTNTGSQQPNPTEWIGPRPNLEIASQYLPPPGIAANPPYFEASTYEGGTVYDMVRLTNRDYSSPVDFGIYIDQTVEGLAPGDWIEVSPMNGTIAAGSFADLLLTFSSENLFDTTYNFKGIINVDFGTWSDLEIPVFFDVLCANTDYDVTESDNSPSTPFTWIDITDKGIRLEPEDFHNSARPDAALDDGTSMSVPTGFPFNFYNDVFTSIYVGVNGGLSFLSDDVNIGGYFADVTLPSPGIEALLLPFWNDLSIDPALNGHGEIYYYRSQGADSLVIEYYQVGNFESLNDSLITFEVILTSDHTITFQYLNVGLYDLAGDAQVALSRDEGCRMVSHCNNGSPPSHLPHNSLRVDFVPAYTILMPSGDADGSGEIDIDDVVYLIAYIFTSGPPPVPIQSGDCDCSGEIDIDDVVYLITYIFSSGPAPCGYEP